MIRLQFNLRKFVATLALGATLWSFATPAYSQSAKSRTKQSVPSKGSQVSTQQRQGQTTRPKTTAQNVPPAKSQSAGVVTKQTVTVTHGSRAASQQRQPVGRSSNAPGGTQSSTQNSSRKQQIANSAQKQKSITSNRQLAGATRPAGHSSHPVTSAGKSNSQAATSHTVAGGHHQSTQGKTARHDQRPKAGSSGKSSGSSVDRKRDQSKKSGSQSGSTNTMLGTQQKPDSKTEWSKEDRETIRKYAAAKEKYDQAHAAYEKAKAAGAVEQKLAAYSAMKNAERAKTAAEMKWESSYDDYLKTQYQALDSDIKRASASDRERIAQLQERQQYLNKSAEKYRKELERDSKVYTNASIEAASSRVALEAYQGAINNSASPQQASAIAKEALETARTDLKKETGTSTTGSKPSNSSGKINATRENSSVNPKVGSSGGSKPQNSQSGAAILPQVNKGTRIKNGNPLVLARGAQNTSNPYSDQFGSQPEGVGVGNGPANNDIYVFGQNGTSGNISGNGQGGSTTGSTSPSDKARFEEQRRLREERQKESASPVENTPTVSIGSGSSAPTATPSGSGSPSASVPPPLNSGSSGVLKGLADSEKNAGKKKATVDDRVKKYLKDHPPQPKTNGLPAGTNGTPASQNKPGQINPGTQPTQPGRPFGGANQNNKPNGPIGDQWGRGRFGGANPFQPNLSPGNGSRNQAGTSPLNRFPYGTTNPAMREDQFHDEMNRLYPANGSPTNSAISDFLKSEHDRQKRQYDAESKENAKDSAITIGENALEIAKDAAVHELEKDGIVVTVDALGKRLAETILSPGAVEKLGGPFSALTGMLGDPKDIGAGNPGEIGEVMKAQAKEEMAAAKRDNLRDRFVVSSTPEEHRRHTSASKKEFEKRIAEAELKLKVGEELNRQWQAKTIEEQSTWLRRAHEEFPAGNEWSRNQKYKQRYYDDGFRRAEDEVSKRK